mmetsp:Transcript_94/g.267  ORF Transcript_94/g.267 Transcript_94/m.267 type:complete len:1155 (-) Transcript_94:417-3881(-)
MNSDGRESESIASEEDFHQEHDSAGVYGTESAGPGSTTSESASASKDEVKEIQRLIGRETRVVQRLRFVVIFAMLLVAAAVTTATFIFLANEEDSDFENSFDLYASTIIESSQFSASAIRGNCNDFAAYVTSTALLMGAEWPFVTLADFEIRASNLRQQTNAIGVIIAPTVEETQSKEWTSYVLQNGGWLGETLFNAFSPYIFFFGPPTEEGGSNVQLGGPTPYSPVWQMDPLPSYPIVNFNLESYEEGKKVSQLAFELGEGAVTNILENNDLSGVFPAVTSSSSSADEPHSTFTAPIYDILDKATRKPVALVHVFLRWNIYFSNKLPEDVRGIDLVLENTCGTTVTWELVGKDAIYKGRGDLHDEKYDSHRVTSSFDFYDDLELASDLGACLYTIHLYPSSALEDEYKTNMPAILTVLVGCVFLFMIVAFVAYDGFQKKRNTKVVVNAARSNQLLTSLFPNNIRDRLLEPDDSKKARNSKSPFLNNNKGQLRSFLDGDYEDRREPERPIADLFLGTTIMFADVTGFTAWSSEREPSQVFMLLETLFSALDVLAKKRRVFKVETVGDCYVAVAGLPEPRADHAVVMARFARDSLHTVQDLVKRLESSLGPDTGELGVRIGLHSGVVTAGVLRGDRARFQLFGDTVNTTARIESTGERNRIHTSKETAELLTKGGKGHWLRPRNHLVQAKGKGELETFWLEINDRNGPVSTTSGSDGTDIWGDAEVTDNKTDRLIDWQVDVFTRLLKQVVARRNVVKESSSLRNVAEEVLLWEAKKGTTPLSEVKEIITLPEFDASASRVEEDPENIDLGDDVMQQLRSFISTLALMYRKNGFHNFEHACHVTMSVTKLLSRIVMPSDLNYAEGSSVSSAERQSDSGSNDTNLKRNIASTLHDHTYGINSDPLTHLSLVFSALIHDVDHTGVPNATLIKENNALASMYNQKSVAEQNSIDLAWQLLEESQFQDLRKCICATEPEYIRFRQLVVQAVLATDIADKELKKLRDDRWNSAFSQVLREEKPIDTVNRKATIVIEHLIQASDVAHTMQHWHVYRKWNECFFRECYQAFQEGRADTDPSLNWYKGEVAFFDFYIIPLAKKLKRCGVFGVSSDEYLNYAIKNRQEWQDRGQEVVEEMVNAIIKEKDTALEQINEDTKELASS